MDDRYFQMTGQTLIEGDFFTTDDFTNDHQRIIINDVFAEKLVPNGSALGAKLIIYDDVLTVIGVVKSVKMPTEIDVPIRAYMRNSWSWNQFVIKHKPNQTLPRELAVTVVQDVSSQFFVHRLETLNDQRDTLLFTHYTTAITTAVLAVLTFFLATIGLYGVLSYATKMRRFELGTRIAIGAKRKDIINLIIKDNAGAVGIGFVISLITLLGLAIGFSDTLASYINLQLISLFSITLLLISVMSLFTCYWPLRAIINKPVIHSLRGSQ
jgi:ABC-type antimicrobial peptide transport system permease subunit